MEGRLRNRLRALRASKVEKPSGSFGHLRRPRWDRRYSPRPRRHADGVAGTRVKWRRAWRHTRLGRSLRDPPRQRRLPREQRKHRPGLPQPREGTPPSTAEPRVSTPFVTASPRLASPAHCSTPDECSLCLEEGTLSSPILRTCICTLGDMHRDCFALFLRRPLGGGDVTLLEGTAVHPDDFLDSQRGTPRTSDADWRSRCCACLRVMCDPLSPRSPLAGPFPLQGGGLEPEDLDSPMGVELEERSVEPEGYTSPAMETDMPPATPSGDELSDTPSSRGVVVGAARPALAWPSDGGGSTLVFDFRNNSKTCLSRAILDASERFDRNPPGLRPGMTAPHCRIRIGPRGTSAGALPHSMFPTLVLCMAAVTVLPLGDTAPNRINVFDALSCGTCEIMRPARDWPGSIRGSCGLTVLFDDLLPGGNPDERILNVPTYSVEPLLRGPSSVIDTAKWGCPNETFRRAADRAWPDLAGVDFSEAFGNNCSNRLHSAGLSTEALYVYMRMRGLLSPNPDEGCHPFLTPTSEWNTFAGWPRWLGAPHPEADWGSSETCTPDFFIPTAVPYAERYRELRPDAGGAWPAAFGTLLPPPLADGALAFSAIVDFGPEAKTSIPTPLLAAGYASRPPLRTSRSDIPGGPYPMTHLYMGARPTDVLEVVFQSADVPAGLATIAARDILCSSGARLFRPRDAADTWRLVLPSGGRLRMRDALPGELPAGTPHHQVAVVDVFRGDLPHVPVVLAWAAFFTPHREWQRQFDDRATARGTLPIAFDDATMSRLQDAGMSDASHYTFLRNRNWVGTAPGRGLEIVAMAFPPLAPGSGADRPVSHFDLRHHLGVSGGGAALTSSSGSVEAFRGTGAVDVPGRASSRLDMRHVSPHSRSSSDRGSGGSTPRQQGPRRERDVSHDSQMGRARGSHRPASPSGSAVGRHDETGRRSGGRSIYGSSRDSSDAPAQLRSSASHRNRVEGDASPGRVPGMGPPAHPPPSPAVEAVANLLEGAMSFGMRTLAQLHPPEGAAAPRPSARTGEAPRHAPPHRAVDPRPPRRTVIVETTGNGHHPMDVDSNIRRGPGENGGGRRFPPGPDTIIGYQPGIRYWKRSVSFEPLRDFVVYIGDTLMEWSPLVEADGSEYDLHPHSRDRIVLKPADRLHGVVGELPLLPAHTRDGIRKVNDDVYCCCRRLRTSDPARTLPALHAAWQRESAPETHRLITSGDWVDRFVVLLDGEEEVVGGWPHFHASLRLQLTRPGFPLDGPRPQLHWDGSTYSQVMEQARRDNHRDWIVRQQQRQETERGMSGGRRITYLVDGNHSRDTSCVRDSEHFVCYTPLQLADLHLFAPAAGIPPHLRVTLGTLRVPMNRGEWLILPGVMQSDGFTDNVLVRTHLAAATRWTVWDTHLQSPRGVAYALEPLTAIGATGLHFSPRQMARVGCITLACVDPAGWGEPILPRLEAPELASPYVPLDADGEEDADLGSRPLQASRLPQTVLQAIGASGLRVGDMMAFLQSLVAETPNILMPHWLEHPTLPELTPGNRAFPVPAPPFRPSAEVMQLRAANGSAPGSVDLRTHLVDRVPAVRLGDAAPTATMVVEGVGEAEAAPSGHSPHAYVSEAWAIAHHVPVERGWVAKALLRADTEAPDTAVDMYRVVGSTRLAVYIGGSDTSATCTQLSVTRRRSAQDSLVHSRNVDTD